MPITYPHEVSEHTSPCHAPNVTGNHVRSDPVFRALLGGNRSKKLQDGIVVVGKNGRERDGLLHELDHSGGRRGGNDRIGRDAKVQRGALQQTVHQLDHHHDELVLAQIVSRLHEDAITLELGRYCHEAVVVVVVVAEGKSCTLVGEDCPPPIDTMESRRVFVFMALFINFSPMLSVEQAVISKMVADPTEVHEYEDSEMEWVRWSDGRDSTKDPCGCWISTLRFGGNGA
mmetsp:Transcript_4801/g.11032  ORF Transcript_4801/g.11032 Transcript_4801/m.11032 type:complete len:230 (-) Transcript_4801:733-1422(-)